MPPPLDAAALEALALRYAGRYATTRARLGAYLERKVKERGWAGSDAPPVAGIVARFAERGYVNDALYAENRAAALGRRGFGARRVRDALRMAGIDEADCAPFAEMDVEEARAAALRFARRKRIGPYGKAVAEGKDRERALAAFIRAGHDFGVARAILALPPGSDPDSDSG